MPSPSLQSLSTAGSLDTGTWAAGGLQQTSKARPTSAWWLLLMMQTWRWSAAPPGLQDLTKPLCERTEEEKGGHKKSLGWRGWRAMVPGETSGWWQYNREWRVEIFLPWTPGWEGCQGWRQFWSTTASQWLGSPLMPGQWLTRILLTKTPFQGKERG